MRYKNPIIPGFHPDPSICRKGDDFYLVTSSFEYFPGVPIFHSRDLVNWRQIGHCLTRKSQLPLEKAWASGGIFAPTIRYHGGKFYMVTTNVSGFGNFFVTATDPAGEWSDPVMLPIGAIDPSLFFDDDGKVYLTGTERVEGKPGISQSEIDIETGKQLSQTKHIWDGTGGRYPEGPHLYKINGMYYLLISEGGTEYGHYVTIARSKSPWGPFESCPHNPILTHRDTEDEIIQGTGHADLIQAVNGSWWLVFLAYRMTAPYFHHLGRETFLAPVSWDKDGWPIIGNKGRVSLEMEADLLAPHSFEKEDSRDDFDEDKLKLCWNFLRNPREDSWSLRDRPSWLCLRGLETSLSDIGSPALVCRRQQHFDCQATSLLDFKPTRDGEEAGLAVYVNDEHHYEVALTMIEGERCVIVRRTVGDLSAIVAKERAQDKSLVLQIRADKDHYYLGYGYNKDQLKIIAKGYTKLLAKEVTFNGFTGAMFALYATGNGKPCTSPAYFDWFDYEHK